MSRYAWIWFSNDEYDWICRHIPESTEWQISKNSDAVHSIRSLYKVLRTCIETETYSEYCQIFKMAHFAKGAMSYGNILEIFLLGTLTTTNHGFSF